MSRPISPASSYCGGFGRALVPTPGREDRRSLCGDAVVMGQFMQRGFELLVDGRVVAEADGVRKFDKNRERRGVYQRFKSLWVHQTFPSSFPQGISGFRLPTNRSTPTKLPTQTRQQDNIAGAGGVWWKEGGITCGISISDWKNQHGKPFSPWRLGVMSQSRCSSASWSNKG